jgi:hypothetical protein
MAWQKVATIQLNHLLEVAGRMGALQHHGIAIDLFCPNADWLVAAALDVSDPRHFRRKRSACRNAPRAWSSRSSGQNNPRSVSRRQPPASVSVASQVSKIKRLGCPSSARTEPPLGASSSMLPKVRKWIMRSRPRLRVPDGRDLSVT